MDTTCLIVVLKLALATTPGKSIIPSPNRMVRLHKMSKLICHFSHKRNLDPVLVLSVAKHESNFTPWLISHTNDYGIMQINSKKRIGTTEFRGGWKCDLLKMKCNIYWGTKIMSHWKRYYQKYKPRRSKGFHWIRHYNWYGDYGDYYRKILWISKAYKIGTKKAFKWIRTRTFPKNLAMCLERKDLCIQKTP